MVALSCVAWSLASIMTGMTNSLLVVALMRASLGAFQGAFEPAAFSIISDQFKEKDRPFANAVLTTGPFIGGGLAAFSIVLIS